MRKSLKTTRYTDAKALLQSHLYRAEKLFAMIRGGMMDDAQIRKLVSEYLKQTLQESLDARIAAPPLSAEEREEELYKHESALDEAAQDLAKIGIASSRTPQRLSWRPLESISRRNLPSGFGSAMSCCAVSWRL